MEQYVRIPKSVLLDKSLSPRQGALWAYIVTSIPMERIYPVFH